MVDMLHWLRAPMKFQELGDPEVYDLDGNKRDMEWLAEWFGVPIEILRADAHPEAEFVLRVVVLRCHEGPAVQIVRVVDQDMMPIEGVEVCRWWQDAPPLQEFPPDCHATRWKPNAVHGPTGPNGDVGFGLGPGDMPGSSGVWPAHCDAPGDWVGNLGWKPHTNHATITPTFQLQKPEEPEPPPNGEEIWEFYVPAFRCILRKDTGGSTT